MRRGKFKVFIFSFFAWMILFHHSLRAQDTTNTIGKVSISSPTAASLGKYGDVPISYNTGIPNINIPIYTVESGSLKLPISLSYHASGLKVEESASWVGAGWSLNAGGVITRSVIGAPDDKGVQAFNTCTNGYYSNYGFSNYEFIYNPGGQGAAYDGYWPDDISFCQGFKDGEPDLYFFNFGSYTGKFYFNDDRTPILVPDADFKIRADLNNGVGGLGFQGFTITTSDGVKYYFGKTGNNKPSVVPVEISEPANTQNGASASNMAVSSWYLNKIISADGMDSITLTYQPETFSTYGLSMFPFFNTTGGNNFVPSMLSGYGLIKTFVQGMRLDSIYFPNGNISFIKSASPRTDLSGYSNQAFNDAANTTSYSLGSIQINNNTGFCKKDSFYYGYFVDNVNALNGQLANYSAYNITSDKYRLRLDSVQEYSCDGSVKIPPHKFSYFSELVPRKLSLGIDHWGFYNGVTGNQGLVPSYTMTTGVANTPVEFFTGANRDAAWPAMRGGSLQQITYPTGGSTNLTFEANNTYCSYTAYSPIVRSGLSVGYDGSTLTTGSYTSSGNTNSFQVTLSSNLTSGTGNLEIIDPGNNIIQNLPMTIGVTDTFYFVLNPSTTYTLKLFKNSSQGTGFGITSTLTELIPSAVNANVIVGGLRIDTLTNYDNVTSNNVVTTYTYTNGGSQSSGIVYSRPVYVQSIRNDVYGWVFQPNTGTPGCQPNAATFYISPSSITPMNTVQGNHIGYNQVQVSQSGNGYSIYRYYGSNYWDYIVSDVCTRSINTGSCTTSIPNFPTPARPFDPMRGELKYEGHFNQSGQILKEASYTPVYVSDSLVTPAHMYILVSGLYSYTPYNLQSSRKVQTKVVESLYDPTTGNPLTTTNTTYFGSLFHTQLTRKVSSTSTGDSLASNFKYAFDFRIPTCDAVPDSLPNYINLINYDSSQFFLLLGSCSAPAWWCRQDSLSNMRRRLTLARINFINYRLRYFSDTGSVAKCYISTSSSADTLLKPIVRLNNLFQNPTIEQTSWKDLNLLHASFIRYDTSVNPIGFAYPGRTKLINLQAPSSTFTNSAVSGTSTIIKDSRYIDESFYNFSKGNPIQVLGKDGVPVSYIWDYLNTKAIAKVTNATADQIAYTSFEADGKGNWIYSGSPTPDAAAITGSKDYNLSNGNVVVNGMDVSKTHIVSYWSKSGAANVNATSGTLLMSKNGWNYYEHSLSQSSSTITVSGTVTIDELRTYPSDALMTSYTYTPMVGMTTSDAVNSYISYYEYDAMGRLLRVRDMDKNIVKQYEYKYAVQPTDFVNVMETGTFTRNNCTTGYIGTSVIDTVLAGKYGSDLSQAAADQQAVNDVNSNGQANANAKGTCVLNSTTITATNSASVVGYSVKYTNTSTLVQTTFSIPTHGGTLGTLTPGTYNIHIGKTGASTSYQFSVNCNSLTVLGLSADFSNVVITTSTCNGISVDFP